jgi:AcrR family transcriptional regulator
MARDTRARLLDAAAAVVRREGAQSLTLEAVAAEAGVSKGGLLYHFHSKHDLLDAMVDHWLSQFQAEIEGAAGEGPAGFATGYVRASDMSGWAAADHAVEFGLLAALIAEPATLARVRDRYAVWQDRVAAPGIDPVEATVARLAADGLWLADLLGLAAPEGDLRRRVQARIVELAAAAGRRTSGD